MRHPAAREGKQDNGVHARGDFSSRPCQAHTCAAAAAGRRGCNRRVSWPPSLSLGRPTNRVRSEPNKIRTMFSRLCGQPRQRFPAKGQTLSAPREQGVYIIRKGRAVFHVGRTTRAKRGLHQRLTAHLHGRSSFTRVFFNRDGDQLRDGYDYQTLVIADPRHRALLESYAAGSLCPRHIGTGE